MSIDISFLFASEQFKHVLQRKSQYLLEPHLRKNLKLIFQVQTWNLISESFGFYAKKGIFRNKNFLSDFSRFLFEFPYCELSEAYNEVPTKLRKVTRRLSYV